MRPKKAATASRENGARATNKGKAKATVPVLTYHPVGPDKYEVRAEKRAKLPKGYLAYETELVTNWLCVSQGRDDARKSNVKQAFGAVQRKEKACEDAAVKMAKDAKHWDVGKKMSQLKELTKGSKTTFTFKEGAAKAPCRQPGRGAGSQ